MRPRKNRFFCMGCRRPKILFDTKEKADAFIRYNSEEILASSGKAPVRSYYCSFCCGYHVTSNPSRVKGESLDVRDELMQSALKRATMKPVKPKVLMSKYSIPAADAIMRAKTMMIALSLDEARALLESAVVDIRKWICEEPKWSKGNGFLEKALLCLQVIDRYELVASDPKQVQACLESSEASSEEGWTGELFRHMILNHAKREDLNARLDEIESAIASGVPYESLESKLVSVKNELDEWTGCPDAKAALKKRVNKLVACSPANIARSKKRHKEKLIEVITSVQQAAASLDEDSMYSFWSNVDYATNKLSKIRDCPEKLEIAAVIENLKAQV